MLFDRGQMYKPYAEFKFNGVSIPDDLKRYISDIEIEESDYEADMAKVTVLDNDFKFSNYVKLLQDQKAEVYIGYQGRKIVEVIGKVSTIEGDFSEDGANTLVITILDKTVYLTSVKRTRKWKDKRASDIAIEIAKSYGFSYSIPQTSTVYEEYTQDDETDGELLQKLAEDEGLVFYWIVRENKLYFGECIKSPQNQGTLHYKMGDTDILSFQPQLVTKDSPNLIEVSAGEVSTSTGQTYRTELKAKIDSTSHQNTTQSSSGVPTVNERR